MPGDHLIGFITASWDLIYCDRGRTTNKRRKTWVCSHEVRLMTPLFSFTGSPSSALWKDRTPARPLAWSLTASTNNTSCSGWSGCDKAGIERATGKDTSLSLCVCVCALRESRSVLVKCCSVLKDWLVRAAAWQKLTTVYKWGDAEWYIHDPLTPYPHLLTHMPHVVLDY